MSKTADAMTDRLVLVSVLVNEDAGVELLTKGEYRCAAGRLIAEFGPETVDETFSQVAEPDLFDSVIAGWSEAMLKCGDFRTWAAIQDYFTKPVFSAIAITLWAAPHGYQMTSPVEHPDKRPGGDRTDYLTKRTQMCIGVHHSPTNAAPAP